MKPKRCDVDEDYQFYVDTLTQNEKIVKLAKPGDFYQIIMKNVQLEYYEGHLIEDFNLKICYKPHF